MSGIKTFLFGLGIAVLMAGCSSSESDSDSDSGDDGDTNDEVVEAVASPTRAGDILINEIMADPDALPDISGEWFEVQNPGSETLNLRDCVFSVGATNFIVNIDFEMDGGDLRTFANSANPGFSPDASYGSSGVSFPNVAGTLVMTCNGVTIDARNYTFTASGRSSSLSGNGNGKWCNDSVNTFNILDTGTPGTRNVDCP